MTTRSYKQNKNSNKGLNIPLAHDNKDLYKTLMHPCIGVCVDIKLVPLIFLNFHAQLVIKI